MKCAVKSCSNEVSSEGAICSKCLEKLDSLFDIENKNILMYICPDCKSIISFTSYSASIQKPKITLINLKCDNCKEIENES